MSLTLNETFRVAAPPDRVWQFLKNPAEVVTCLPGAELTGTIDAQTYAGRVKVKVGPITAAYAGKASLAKVDDVDVSFDPLVHEAVLTEAGDGADDEPVVTEIMRSGYAWNGRVVRPAMVKVRG